MNLNPILDRINAIQNDIDEMKNELKKEMVQFCKKGDHACTIGRFTIKRRSSPNRQPKNKTVKFELKPGSEKKKSRFTVRTLQSNSAK